MLDYYIYKFISYWKTASWCFDSFSTTCWSHEQIECTIYFSFVIIIIFVFSQTNSQQNTTKIPRVRSSLSAMQHSTETNDFCGWRKVKKKKFKQNKTAVNLWNIILPCYKVPCNIRSLIIVVRHCGSNEIWFQNCVLHLLASRNINYRFWCSIAFP